MTEQWQKAVFIDPEQLEPGAASLTAVPPARNAREIPLDAVVEVGDEELWPTSADVGSAVAPARKRSGWRRLLTGSVVAVLGAGVGMELYRLLSWGYGIHPVLGTGFGLLLLLALLAATVQGWRSLKGLRQLRSSERLQAQAQRLLELKTQGQAGAFLQRLEQHYSGMPQQRELLETLQQIDTSYSDGEVIRFLAEHALAEQDLRARACVKRYSVESGVMVALSPWASFDMLLVGWRNLRMLREIADIYGIAPGAAAQWALLKGVAQNIAFAGLSEMALDAGAEALGSSLATKLSARAGQGLGAGLFTARTGQQGIRLCRPIPLTADRNSLFSAVSGAILERLGSTDTGSGR